MILLGTVPASAQVTDGSSFEISNVGRYDADKLTAALKNCQLDRYRKLNSRSILQFEDGTTVSLLSVKELEALGIAVDKTTLLGDNEENKNVFRLKPNGYIMEILAPAPSLEQQKEQEDMNKGGGSK